MDNATVEISIVDPNRSLDALKEIQKLRYQVYVKEMQLDLPGVDHARELLPDALDIPALHITAKIDSVLAGAVRLNTNIVPKGLELPLQTLRLPKPFVYCSRLYILGEFRGRGVLSPLAEACFEQFFDNGAAVAICHCYPHLFKLYERLGFRQYGSPFVLPGLERFGAQTPFRCMLARQRANRAA